MSFKSTIGSVWKRGLIIVSVSASQICIHYIWRICIHYLMSVRPKFINTDIVMVQYGHDIYTMDHGELCTMKNFMVYSML